MLCLFDFHVDINFSRWYFYTLSRFGQSAVYRNRYYIHCIKQVSFHDPRSHDELYKLFHRHTALYLHYNEWLKTMCNVIPGAPYRIISLPDISFFVVNVFIPSQVMLSGSLDTLWGCSVGLPLLKNAVRSWCGGGLAPILRRCWQGEFMSTEAWQMLRTTRNWRGDELSSPQMALWPSTAIRMKTRGGIGVRADIAKCGPSSTPLVRTL